MSLLFPSNNDAILAVERGGKSVDLESTSEDWLYEADEASASSNGCFGAVTSATNCQTIIVDVEKPICLSDVRSPDRHIAIAEQDAADMVSLCSGDNEAMTRLMCRHASRLQMTVERILQNRSEAVEVVEEAFIRVHQNRLRFDLQAKFTPWLYTIALNLARNHLRSRARQPEMIPLEELTEEELEARQRSSTREPAPDVCLVREEAARQLEVSFAALPPQLREPLQLFACEEYSQIEIAKQFNCSVKAIECRLYNARKQLRAKFERFL